VQFATPEAASVAAQLIVTAALYQPFGFAWRSGVAVTFGAVESYLSGYATVAETLPATSRHVPLGAALPLSGPLYVIAVQEAIPDVASLPFQLIPTGWRYQAP
jgi:hypothetical protein